MWIKQPPPENRVWEQPAWRHVAGSILHLNHFDIYYSFYEQILCGSYYRLTATCVRQFLHCAHRSCLVLSFHMQKNDLMLVWCGSWLFFFEMRKVVKHLRYFKETEFVITCFHQLKSISNSKNDPLKLVVCSETLRHLLIATADGFFHHTHLLLHSFVTLTHFITSVCYGSNQRAYFFPIVLLSVQQKITQFHQLLEEVVKKTEHDTHMDDFVNLWKLCASWKVC